jgi:hypothetical protein
MFSQQVVLPWLPADGLQVTGRHSDQYYSASANPLETSGVTMRLKERPIHDAAPRAQGPRCPMHEKGKKKAKSFFEACSAENEFFK